jgi:hypothetical protein
MASWHYITKDGQRGPVDAGQLRQLYVSNVIGLDTSIWSEGMKSWEPLSFYSGLLGQVAAKPSQSDTTSAVGTPVKKNYASQVKPTPDKRRGHLSLSQKLVLFGVVILTLGMILYPPFHFIRQGTIHNMGYQFLLFPPKVGNFTATVDTSMLVIQLIGVLIVGGSLWFFSCPSIGVIENAGAHARKLPPNSVQKITFFTLRAIRAIVGLIFIWQIVGMLPVLTWIASPADVTPDMAVRVFIKLCFGIIFGFIFVGLRQFISGLYFRWNGMPHPSLAKRLSL